MKKIYLYYKSVFKNSLLNIFQRLFFDPLNLVINKGTSKKNLIKLIKILRPGYESEKLIRIGNINDGGYLVPNDIHTYNLIISPGVGNTSEFDKYFIDKEIKVIQIDPNIENADSKFLKKYAGYLRGSDCLKNNYISLESIFADLNTNYTRIEGAEYEVINSISTKTLNKFSLLVIELHNMSSLFNANSHNLIETSLLKIIDSFFVAHIHVNNTGRIAYYSGIEIPDKLEITFLNRRDYIENRNIKFFKYHALDAACSEQIKEVFLPAIWNKIFLSE